MEHDAKTYLRNNMGFCQGYMVEKYIIQKLCLHTKDHYGNTAIPSPTTTQRHLKASTAVTLDSSGHHHKQKKIVTVTCAEDQASNLQ
jgi:hypothetical protein